jgi:hypothetical protein
MCAKKYCLEVFERSHSMKLCWNAKYNHALWYVQAPNSSVLNCHSKHNNYAFKVHVFAFKRDNYLYINTEKPSVLKAFDQLQLKAKHSTSFKIKYQNLQKYNCETKIIINAGGWTHTTAIQSTQKIQYKSGYLLYLVIRTDFIHHLPP